MPGKLSYRNFQNVFETRISFVLTFSSREGFIPKIARDALPKYCLLLKRNVTKYTIRGNLLSKINNIYFMKELLAN